MRKKIKLRKNVPRIFYIVNFSSALKCWQNLSESKCSLKVDKEYEYNFKIYFNEKIEKDVLKKVIVKRLKRFAPLDEVTMGNKKSKILRNEKREQRISME